MNTQAKPAYLQDDIVSTTEKDLASFIYLVRFALPFKWRFVAAFSLIIGSALLTMSAARALGYLVDSGIKSADLQLSLVLGGAVLLLEVLALAAQYCGRLLLARASSESILNIRSTAFQHLQRLPLSYFDRQPLGRTITRMTSDIEALDEFFGSSMGRLLTSLVLALTSMIAMLATDLTIGAILTVAMLPALILTLLFRTKARFLNREMSRKNSAVNSRLAEFLNGISVIRAFGVEHWSKERFDATISSHLSTSIELNRYFSMIRPVISLAAHLPLLVLLWFGGLSVLAGTMQLGLFVTFIRYCDRFSRPIETFSREIHLVQQAFANGERVAVFLQAPTEESELGANGGHRIEHVNGEIDVRGVTMSYDAATPVLKNISFSVSAGQKVGLAGKTGSGKTTTLALLARLYEFQSGEILIDGKPIRHYDRESLRNTIGLVSQDVVIFRGSLRENLSLNPAVRDDSIEAACRQTGLTEIMQARQLSLDSEVLDKGENLSVGERQLVALTRVLIKNPSLLILDEATANIDPSFERIIHDAVDTLLRSRTCFLIAHRLDTLRSCDKLLVFRDGEIVEQGSHQELLSRHGYYASLHESNLLYQQASNIG